MNKIGSQIFQDFSDVDLFNKIGFMVSELNYEPIYFKCLMPRVIETENGIEYSSDYMHYIHIIEDGELKISIYYDKYNMGAMFPEQPYFELYDKLDIERFLDTDLDRENLLNRLKDLI